MSVRMSVDLPAPFLPMSPQISPSRTTRSSAGRSARVPQPTRSALARKSSAATVSVFVVVIVRGLEVYERQLVGDGAQRQGVRADREIEGQRRGDGRAV